MEFPAGSEVDLDQTMRSPLPSGRRIGFATVGSAAGRPAVLFVMLGGGRKTAQFHAEAAAQRGFRVIVVDRPGSGLTDAASEADLAVLAGAGAGPTKHPERHMWTASQDVLAVLTELGYASDVHVLACCAGLHFALDFAGRYGAGLLNPQAPMVCLSPFVSPRDCGDHKFFFKLGAIIPTALISAFVGSMASSTLGLAQWLPEMSLPRPETTVDFSEAETAEHSDAVRGAISEAVFHMNVRSGEPRNMGDDASVCVAAHGEEANDQYQVIRRCFAGFTVFATPHDDITPFATAEWVVQRVGSSPARTPEDAGRPAAQGSDFSTLVAVPGRSHVGLMVLPDTADMAYSRLQGAAAR